ncbi:MAG: DUF937 domain-containing protein [Pirellulaceae bacterium]
MAINLLDMVKSAVVGQVADQIGSAVGLDKSKTSAAVNAVLPALLGGMAKKASTPAGASDLIKALQDNDNSILDNLAGAFAPAKQSSMLDYGMKLLPMLLGGSQSTIISLIAKMFGFGDKGASSLMGMLAPVVMSVVGKQVKSGGLDASGLASLLSGQSNFLSAALPSELKNVMGFADLGGANRPAATTTQRTTTSHSTSHSAPEAANPLKFLLPLLLLAALGFLGYQFLKPKPQAATAPAVITPAPKAPPAVTAEVKPPAMDPMIALKEQLTSTFEGLNSTLGGITDEASATAAVEKIKAAATGYSALGIEKMSAETRTGLVPFLKPLFDKVKAALDAAYKIPGVQGIIEPVIGPMVQAVSAVAG